MLLFHLKGQASFTVLYHVLCSLLTYSLVDIKPPKSKLAIKKNKQQKRSTKATTTLEKTSEEAPKTVEKVAKEWAKISEKKQQNNEKATKTRVGQNLL
ncbi:hypothetical protein EPR50_G00241260 [Perca flavescens]|uniref:Uncharacterized protein n=1 Tax=Perca flavescens TaxID=8167 RepID=A0A484C611_PERFV|nr:hypothetical protein EPR50_G00241260 [Perca flavescens]